MRQYSYLVILLGLGLLLGCDSLVAPWDVVGEYEKQDLVYLGKNEWGYDEYENPIDGSVLIYIPAGEFVMGSPSDAGDLDETPQHPVYLDGYFIGKYEITVAQFKKFCALTGYSMPKQPSWNEDNYPVVNVLWYDAVAYCEWAGLRLPTEAEWEKSARGTDGRKYPWGNNEPYHDGVYYANYGGVYDTTTGSWEGDSADGYYYTAPVGSFPQGASPYGCMDMAGNVWEWCLDWYDEDYYSESPYENPQGPDSGFFRVIRGGGWVSPGRSLRVANRNSPDLGTRYCEAGFRPAASK